MVDRVTTTNVLYKRCPCWRPTFLLRQSLSQIDVAIHEDDDSHQYKGIGEISEGKQANSTLLSCIQEPSTLLSFSVLHWFNHRRNHAGHSQRPLMRVDVQVSERSSQWGVKGSTEYNLCRCGWAHRVRFNQIAIWSWKFQDLGRSCTNNTYWTHPYLPKDLKLFLLLIFWQVFIGRGTFLL